MAEWTRVLTPSHICNSNHSIYTLSIYTLSIYTLSIYTLSIYTLYLHTIYTDHESVQLAAVPAVEVAVGGRLGLGQAGHALLAANTWTEGG